MKYIKKIWKKFSLIRYIFGRDIFISYSRSDTFNYSEELTLALQERILDEDSGLNNKNSATENTEEEQLEDNTEVSDKKEEQPEDKITKIKNLSFYLDKLEAPPDRQAGRLLPPLKRFWLRCSSFVFPRNPKKDESNRVKKDGKLPRSLKRHLRWSSCLAVICTPNAVNSIWVKKEIKYFSSFGGKVMLIDVANTLPKVNKEESPWKKIKHAFPTSVKESRLTKNSTPSNQVLKRIIQLVKFTTQDKRLKRSVWGTAFLILLLLGGTGYILTNAWDSVDAANEKVAGANKKVAEAEKKAEKITEDANKKVAKANAKVVVAEGKERTANENSRKARKAQTVAEDKEIKAKKQTEDAKKEVRKVNKEIKNKNEENSLLTVKNVNLVTQTNNLQIKANDLSKESKMVQIRIAAQNQITEDPQIAYQLAKKAYKLKPDHKNRKLIFSALSKIDLFYKYQLADYLIEDYKEPFILLGRGQRRASNQGKNFLVFNVKSQNATPINIKSDKGWIVPIGNEWRLLTLDRYGFVYQLWDSEGKELGTPVDQGYQGYLTYENFLDERTVRIPLSEDNKLLTWDLAHDIRKIVPHDYAILSDNFPYNREGILDTNRDGILAVPYKRGLVLVDSTGNLLIESYTNLGSPVLGARGKWSPDNQYLALDKPSNKRLGIWNPAKRFFKWLDPDGWIVESYSWSNSGHLLALSGRTEAESDITISIIDPSLPKLESKIIYKDKIRITNISFLPNDKQLAITDSEGKISIIQISDGQVLRTGRHLNVKKLFVGENALFSSSASAFKIWSYRDNLVGSWRFQSTEKRVYTAVVAADSTWSWIAVGFMKNMTIGGIELRKIRTGEKFELSLPGLAFNNRIRKLEFSKDGKWLVVETWAYIRIYDTDSWIEHDFSLQKDDRHYSLQKDDLGFQGLRIVGDTVYAHVLGKGRGNEYDYIIELKKNLPILPNRIYTGKKDTITESYPKRLIEEDKYRDFLFKETDGWELGNRDTYKSWGIIYLNNSGLVYYIRCRDSGLSARNCDIQFLPTNLERVVALYDSLIWNPTEEELKPWLP